MEYKNAFHAFYLHSIVYYIGFGAAGLFVISYFFVPFFTLALALLSLLVVAILIDAIILFSAKKRVQAKRLLNLRFSNGEENEVKIQLVNNYHFSILADVIDEIPFQFQARDWLQTVTLKNDETKEVIYHLQPVERGLYSFGYIDVFVSSPLRLVQRRFVFSQSQKVKVYPSFVQMRRYQLLAIGNRLSQAGTKKIRRLGHSMEFEQIKEYVRGDDYRTVNWKATARRGDLMVNNYTDERSQQVFCLINKSRMMKMPFEGMTLLDYAINAALVLLNVAMLKQDKAGLITFAETTDTFIAPDKKPAHLNLLLETLYKQKTRFLEPDLEQLFAVVRNRITQRSLLVLFTNYETVESLQRDLSFFKRLSHYHLLVVVLFENTELATLMESKAKTTEDIYIKTIAQKFALDKKAMVKELHQLGIIAVLSTPQNLTVNTLNKYLELKNRHSI